MAANTGHRVISAGSVKLVPQYNECFRCSGSYVEEKLDCSAVKSEPLVLELKIKNTKYILLLW
jgi:hypothetical protein